MPCPVCSSPVPTPRRGPARRFCSEKCRGEARRGAYRAEVLAAAQTVEALTSRLRALEAERAAERAAAVEEMTRVTGYFQALVAALAARQAAA